MRCPNCREIDQVQSAAAIYQAGTTHTTGKSRSSSWFGPSYTHTHQSSHQTNLAHRLAPPERKTGQQVFTALISFLSMKFLWDILHNHIQKTGSGRLPIGYTTGEFLIGLFFVIFIVRIAVNARQRSAQAKRWDKLWYCHRCNLEFVAETA